MTIVSIAIVTTTSLLNDVIEANTPKEAVLKFLDNLELEPRELIGSVVCSSLDHNYEFTDEVEQLLYTAIPELYLPGYEWVESV
jgi:hypothetical protein